MNLLIFNSLFNKKINKFMVISKTNENKENQYCDKCNKQFVKIYEYKNIILKELDIHNLLTHNVIDIDLYEKISELNLKNFDIYFINFRTNDMNIMDGLYEIGSNQIYIEKTKNIKNSKINRFSEHYGFIEILGNKINKIITLNKSRTIEEEKLLYLPVNDLETFNYQIIYHTHPRFKNYGKRSSIIFEYPSISDIMHFIDHHNYGKLLCSLIITPEGLYNIRKYNFNNEKIKIDTTIFTNKIESILLECEEYFYRKYYYEVITKELFFNKIIYDTFYINRINEELKQFDIAIDFYGRNNFNDNYIFTNIFIPIITQNIKID